MKRIAIITALFIVTAACGAAPESNDQPSTGTLAGATTTTVTAPATTTLPPVESPSGVAPWSGAPLQQSTIPEVLIEQWNQADNQQWCSALFPADPASLALGASIRSAYFGGGWAVAWDLTEGPGRFATGEYCEDCGRGAFGVAGTGGLAFGNEADRWPSVIRFEEGSKFGYGFEGDAAVDSGAPLLAYLLVRGEGCNYNIWSFLGEDHLLGLMSELRRVEGLVGEPTLWLSEIPPPEVETLGSPPWDEPALLSADIPDEAIAEWVDEASAPAGCPMLFPADLGDAADATIRRANNEGEMLVAWDLPSGPGHSGDSSPCPDCGRGVVGLGTFPIDSMVGHTAYTWADGSEAIVRSEPPSYGIEAFVAVKGFDCTYWMWSHLGRDHLEYLFSQLRRVEFPSEALPEPGE